MFEIGFWELVLIGVLVLVVAGPERLPGIARGLGQLAGRGRALLRVVREEMERESQSQGAIRPAPGAAEKEKKP
ncbi:MAG TPA: twin-arginine translocase TatA/TatE family subunit [Gammaproteobacteria bacterium]|nr:twin-arginine translocase TatA/TatE family subunit [Gammaproteobacteria bacterium]